MRLRDNTKTKTNTMSDTNDKAPVPADDKSAATQMNNPAADEVSAPDSSPMNPNAVAEAPAPAVSPESTTSNPPSHTTMTQNNNTPAGSVSDANVASANLNAGTDSAPVQDVAPATPAYKKWFTPAPMLQSRSGESGTPIQPGEILDQGGDNRDQDPPTNGESFSFNDTVEIPMDVDDEGNPVPVTANLEVTYNVEDWGTASLDGTQIIDLSSSEASTGPLGGHTTWGKTANVAVQSGNHNLDFTYQNITMPNPNFNKIVCNYTFKAVALEPGGKKEPDPCGCSGNTCSMEGGTGSSGTQTRSVLSSSPQTSSSAATSVTADLTEDSMLWSCNVATLRGLGALLTGKVQIYAQEFSAALATPAALAFDHPMGATLLIPEGGIVPGAKLEITTGDRVIALRCYSDGGIAPIGVDSAGRGKVTVTRNDENAVSSLKWQDSTGAAWVFDGVSGALISYTSPDMVTVSDVSSYMVVKRHASDGSLRQIWSLWDGLLNIENITATGYRIALYAADQVAGVDAEGFYTLVDNAAPFKTFTLSASESGITIVEAAPNRQNYVCSWSMGVDGAWSLVKGSGEEAVTVTRVRSEVESAASTQYEVWQLVTTTSRGGVTASCVCEVYQNSPMGNLLLTRVEGYGSAAAQTTTYEYDGLGNMVKQTNPNGHIIEKWYDSTGRVTKTREPWHDDQGTLITTYTYADPEDGRYSSDLAEVKRHVYPAGASTMVTLSTETHTHTISNGVKREEVQTTATGSSQMHLEITETWTDDAPNALDKGRLRMSQAVNGVQTWYTYTSTSSYGALYSITEETRVEGEAVEGQSRRSVKFINEAGNTVREEEYVLLPGGTWAKISGVTHSYNVQNQRIGSTRDNGRSSSRDVTCRGEVLWEIDENGVRTDYAYDSARFMTEESRDAVYDGDTCITPETITEYTRDAEGRVLVTTKHTGAMVTETSTQYDLAGRVISKTDVLGRSTTTAYSADGLTTTVTTPAGATRITTSHTDGSLASQSGTGQRALYYSYDIADELLRQSVKLADNAILEQTLSNGFDETVVVAQASTTGYIYTRSEYNAKGQLIKQYQDTGTTETAMAATVYEYDSMGNRSKETLVLDEAEPEDNTKNSISMMNSSYEVQEDGSIWQVNVERKNNTLGDFFGYTQKSLLSESSSLESATIIIDQRGKITSEYVNYDPANSSARTHTSQIPTSVLSASLRVVDGFTCARTDYTGISESFTRSYTSTGSSQTATNGRGNNTITQMDIAGRTVSISDAANAVTTVAYDAYFDQPSVLTNAQGKTACYKYDLRGRKVAEWGTAIQPAVFGYDDADNLISRTTFRVDSGDITTDPSERTDGDTTTWVFDSTAGVELSKIGADNSSIVKTYDSFNRLLTQTNARGDVKTMSYDSVTGLLLGVSFSDQNTPDRSFGYDFLGQLTQIIDAAGTRTIVYNEYGEPQSDSLNSGAHTHLVTELRDSYGRSTGFTYARSGSTQFTTSVGYATDGRIATAGFMHGGVNRQFSYSYLSGSNLLHTLTQPNGITLTQSYEEHRDLLTGMQYHRGSTLVVERSYSYDTLGRPTNRSTARQGSVKNDTFTHNDRSELTAATLGTAAYSYSYDNIGNRKTAQEAAEEATAYDANNLNQYTAIQEGTAEAFVPTFDADGNQTKVKTSTGIWNVVYNAENRPVTFTSADGATIVECTYDYMGRRHTRKITVNGSVTNYLRYIYRGYLQIAAINAVSGVFQWFILWDPTEEVATRPLGIRKDGTWYTYGWDLTKNICEVFGSDGYIKTAYTYTPYGCMTANGNVTQPIQWSSEYNDSELGLAYFNYRHYNPVDGRWLSLDMAENEANLYMISGNSVFMESDALGLACVSVQDPSMRRYKSKSGAGPVIVSYDFGISKKTEFCCTACSAEKAGVEINSEISLYVAVMLEVASYSIFVRKGFSLGIFKGELMGRFWAGLRVYGSVSSELYASLKLSTCNPSNVDVGGGYRIVGSVGFEGGFDSFVKATLYPDIFILSTVAKKSVTFGFGASLGGRIEVDWRPRMTCSMSGCTLSGPADLNLVGTARLRFGFANMELSLTEKLGSTPNMELYLPLNIMIPASLKIQ